MRVGLSRLLRVSGSPSSLLPMKMRPSWDRVLSWTHRVQGLLFWLLDLSVVVEVGESSITGNPVVPEISLKIWPWRILKVGAQLSRLWLWDIWVAPDLSSIMCFGVPSPWEHYLDIVSHIVQLQIRYKSLTPAIFKYIENADICIIFPSGFSCAF